MIKIQDKGIYRDGVKIGWMEGPRFFEVGGGKAGYISAGDIFNGSGVKVAYVTEGRIKRVGMDETFTYEKINKEVKGGGLEDLERGAIFILFQEE